MFAGRHGFITVRDLLRWAGRKNDSYRELVQNGYTLLAERLRQDDDKAEVKEVLEKCCRNANNRKVEVDVETLYYGKLDDEKLLDLSLKSEKDAGNHSGEEQDVEEELGTIEQLEAVQRQIADIKSQQATETSVGSADSAHSDAARGPEH